MSKYWFVDTISLCSNITRTAFDIRQCRMFHTGPLQDKREMKCRVHSESRCLAPVECDFKQLCSKVKDQDHQKKRSVPDPTEEDGGLQKKNTALERPTI